MDRTAALERFYGAYERYQALLDKGIDCDDAYDEVVSAFEAVPPVAELPPPAKAPAFVRTRHADTHRRWFDVEWRTGAARRVGA
jgi:hypothetical protein